MSLYTNLTKYPKINNFLNEQQILLDEQILLPLKSYFPEFLTDFDQMQIIGKEFKFELPKVPFPKVLNYNSVKLQTISENLKRILLYNQTTIRGYPFHLLIHLWIKFTSKYPPFNIQEVSNCVYKISFKYFIPKQIKIISKIESTKFQFSIDSVRYINLNNNELFFLPKNKSFYLKMSTKTQFYFKCKKEKNLTEFIKKYKTFFIDEIKQFIFNWNTSFDISLISNFSNVMMSSNLLINKIDPKLIINLIDTKFQLNLLCIRSYLIILLNWLFYYNNISFDDNNSSRNILIKSMLPSLRNKRFVELINEKSNDETIQFEVNRKESIQLRNGDINDLNKSLINQFVKLNINPLILRKKGLQPFNVRFVDEIGVDAGGLAREFVNECVNDLTSMNCGLFISLKNNNEIIPVNDQKVLNHHSCYVFVGALIGICIRTNLVQNFNFASIVWEYLASGNLNIQQIFEIDNDFNQLIKDLNDALTKKTSKEDFDIKFGQLKFEIKNMRGEVIPLSQRGRVEKVTLENCNEFIALAIDYKLSELRNNLQDMYEGLWGNLGFKAPAFITAQMLEESACGENELTFDILSRIIRFEGISGEQQRQFIRVLKQFTNEQRLLFLRFSTGRARLPLKIEKDFCIIVNHTPSRDYLPSASTCFNQFHLPFYSSFEKMFNMIRIAIENTESFENR